MSFEFSTKTVLNFLTRVRFRKNLKMKLKKIFSILFLIFAPIFVHGQCAMCRAVLESSGNTEQSAALNNGIMYLMIFPYVLIGGLGIFAWWNLSRKNKKSENL